MTILTTCLTAVGAIAYGLSCGWGLVAGIPAWDAFSQRIMGTRVPDGIRLGLPPHWFSYGLRVWGLLLLGNMALFWFVLDMWPVALVTSWLVYVAPRYLLDFACKWQRTRLRDQMVSATLSLASSVEAGLSLPQGLAHVVAQTPAPLCGQLHRIVADFNRGRPLRDAIQAVRESLQLDSFTLFAAAMQVTLERGGQLEVSLQRISRSLQENQRLERRLAAETAAGMRLVQILAILPFGLLLFLQPFAPEEVGYLYSTLAGQFILAAVILLDYAGIRMAARVVRMPI